jgi:uncharacterized membrane protein YfcA
MEKNIIGILLVIHGLYSLYRSYKGTKTIHWELPATTYIFEKIFGKNFDKWHNFFWGTIEVLLGIGFLIYINFPD